MTQPLKFSVKNTCSEKVKRVWAWWCLLPLHFREVLRKCTRASTVCQGWSCSHYSAVTYWSHFLAITFVQATKWWNEKWSVGLEANCSKILEYAKIIISGSVGKEQPRSKILSLKYEWMCHKMLTKTCKYVNIYSAEATHNPEHFRTSLSHLHGLRDYAVPAACWKNLRGDVLGFVISANRYVYASPAWVLF